MAPCAHVEVFCRMDDYLVTAVDVAVAGGRVVEVESKEVVGPRSPIDEN